MFEQSPREGTKASKGSMATSKGSWANALRQPKQASTSNSQSRAPSGSATPVPPTVSAGSDVPSATATATTATTPDAHAHANSVNSVNPANPASQGDYLRLLGAHLELTMNDEQHHTGFLYAFDATMAVVALSSQPAPQHGLTASYAIFKSTEVKQVRVIEGLPPALLPPNKQWMPPSADITRVAHNIDFAVKADQQRATRLGKGVSPLAQQVFDALSKTLPTSWAGQSILVLEDIMVSPPNYDTQSCAFKPDAATPSSSNQQTKMQRLHKVLAGERAKLLQHQPELANGNA